MHVLAPAMLTAQVNGKRARAMVDDDPFILATDYADYLTRKGVPFREAHRVVGQLVRICESSNRGLRELSLDDLRMVHESFGRDAVGMTIRDALAARDVPGGTAPRRVRQALTEGKGAGCASSLRRARSHERPRGTAQIELAPSILAADWTRIGEQVREAEAAGFDAISLDVMDGAFVPPITFGAQMLEAVRSLTDLPIRGALDGRAARATD